MDNEFVKRLGALIGEARVFPHARMSDYTTFRIGGPAEILVEPTTVEEVCDVVSLCQKEDVPYRIMGLGSDLLVSDEGVRGVIIRIAENMAHIRIEGECVQVQAGCSNEALAHKLCEAGLAGYEFACGIPGTVGGAAIMNAGAYGGEFKDVAKSVQCLTPQGELVEVSAQEAAWSYRHSMMDDAGYIVLSATLQLSFASKDAVRTCMDDFTQRRLEKQPLELPSAGSTFKRPTGYFVGQLVQEAGLRGFQVGGAQVSEKHTGFVVNAGAATAADVRNLISEVQKCVFAHAGVKLVPEVRMWGFEHECAE